LSKDKVSRRRFVKFIAVGALVGAAGISGVSVFIKRRQSWAGQKSILGSYDWDEHYWGFIVDTKLCIGCGRCVVACKVENNVPMEPEFNRTWVERYVVDRKGEIYVDSPNAGMNGFEDVTEKYGDIDIRQSFFVPKLCNQCTNPPCVQVCPVGATYVTKDGVVLIDRERCIGCRYCIQACPYGARYLLPEEHVADKCTWCYHRITKGLKPACVEVCPVGARIFGDLRNPDGRFREYLRTERLSVLKPDLGTKPKVYYTGLIEGVR